MNQIAMNQSPATEDHLCSGVTALAELELSAFFTALTELFGVELATLSAEDWLNELLAIEDLPSSAREWRQLTLNVSTRLAAFAGLQTVAA